jgi:riboflavin synthase
MFTGIIEEVGTVARINQEGENRRITVEATSTPKELKTGESVSVSGVCLTALDIQQNSFSADLAPETWTRTSFSRLREGARVNLELSMRANGRFGGHIVQGHVDAVGKMISLDRIEDSDNWWLKIEIPAEIEKYTVFKGSISIEGISLTVADLSKNNAGSTSVCKIAVIPHTVAMTNLGSLKPGDAINLEADLIAKYVEKMMKRDSLSSAISSAITIKELVRQGF